MKFSLSGSCSVSLSWSLQSVALTLKPCIAFYLVLEGVLAGALLQSVSEGGLRSGRWCVFWQRCGCWHLFVGHVEVARSTSFSHTARWCKMVCTCISFLKAPINDSTSFRSCLNANMILLWVRCGEQTSLFVLDRALWTGGPRVGRLVRPGISCPGKHKWSPRLGKKSFKYDTRYKIQGSVCLLLLLLLLLWSNVPRGVIPTYQMAWRTAFLPARDV